MIANDGVYRIFLSHCSSDDWEAWHIQQELEKFGAEVFLDFLRMETGEDFEKVILENLDCCDEFWVLWTPTQQSLKMNQQLGNVKSGLLGRPYVWLETGVAWHRNIPIVSLLKSITKAELASDDNIPLLIKKRQVIELGKKDNIPEYIRLLKAVRKNADEKRKTINGTAVKGHNRKSSLVTNP